MNRILLIGNGFDLAHGLKTSYKDFINALWKKEKTNIISTIKKSTGEHIRYESDIVSVYIPSRHKEDILISDEIKNGYNWLKNIDTKYVNTKIEHKNTFLVNISDKAHLQYWLDIEEEYHKQLLGIIDTSLPGRKYFQIEKLNQDFFQIKTVLENYLQELQTKNNIKLFPKIQEKIFADWKPIDCMKKEKSLTASAMQKKTYIPENILFLSFNYTHTERGYLYNFANPHIRVERIHIHGELMNENNPIIFGYGDEIADEYKAIEKKNDNRFLENIKSIKYLETDNYKKLLNFINSDDYQIFIMGHSCGLSDRTLLNTLFEHDNCVSIKIFYHKKEDGTDNYSDVARNISRNFNNKAVMREKVVNKQYCEALL
ncbi:MAG: bacteriophage abortive infection AbiH family protein [Bacteroidetes bacterium]|nr:bacteriophage abortive infection AbiH family protein [Bacteroidota bacterium]MCL2302468.1 bacteriophage abortive infection AbiH family protein [Lentimicrobiaceae bacterium]